MGETQSNWRMCAQDPVLGDEILDLQQQFRIDEPGHAGQETNPFAAFHPTDIFSSLRFRAPSDSLTIRAQAFHGALGFVQRPFVLRWLVI